MLTISLQEEKVKEVGLAGIGGHVMLYNERIRELRKDRAMVQQEVADMLEVGQRTYADYENGKTRIPVKSLLILARFYDVSMDYISGASDVKERYPCQ